MTFGEKAGIPDGLVVELSRGTVLDGRSDEADRWMQMLRDRREECIATLDRDHLAAAKRTKEPGWVEAEPQVVLLPAPVEDAVRRWALRPRDTPTAAD